MKPEKQIAPAKLADDHGYRVASEALRLAADHGCPEGLYAALFEIVKREAKRVEGSLDG
jgi:hypothetical protein